jgi:hypothetical protein
MQRDYVLIMLQATAPIMGMQLRASRNQTIETVPVATPLAHAVNVAPIDGCEWATVTMQYAQAYAALFRFRPLLTTYCRSIGLLLHPSTLIDTNSVGLLSTSDRTVAEAST